MKITTKGQYALLTVLFLAKLYTKNKNRFVTTQTVANGNDIPKEFLEKIVASLSKAGFLDSHPGAKGGIKLAKSPEKISVAQVIREIDGPIAPVSCVSKLKYEESPIEKSKNLTFLFRRIRDIQDKILRKTKFSDLI